MLDDRATLPLDDFTEASATSSITDPGPDPTWYPNPYPGPDGPRRDDGLDDEDDEGGNDCPD